MAADEIDVHELFLQRQFRVLKDGSDKAGESFMTITTLELIVPILADKDMSRAAERTDKRVAQPVL